MAQNQLTFHGMGVCFRLLTLALMGTLPLACKAKHAHRDAGLLTGGASCIPQGAKVPFKPGDVPTGEMIRTLAKVTDDEIKAVHTYTDSVHATGIIKDILKGDLPESDLEIYRAFMGINYEKVAHNFKSAVHKISQTVPFKGTVYRGIVVSEETLEAIKKLALQKKFAGLGRGGERDYTSSSRSRQFAEDWLLRMESEGLRDLNQKKIKKVFYEIKQCRGAAIEGIEIPRRGETQKEVILPPADYVIHSFQDLGHTLKLSLTEVGCSGLSLVDDTGPQGLGLAETDPLIMVEDPILQYFDFSGETGGDSLGLALISDGLCPDPRLREKYTKDFNRLDQAVSDVKKAEQDFLAATEKAQASKNSAPQEAARAALRTAQTRARDAARSFSTAVQAVRPVRAAAQALKLVPVVGYMAEGAAFALGIAEAVELKKRGGSDSAAAAAVLAGWGVAGAIPAILACNDCTPDEKAAAFFSGFFGVDFTNLVICPGKRCPEDQDLAGYGGAGNSSDWSLHRIKKSCPKGVPVAGTQHAGTEVNLICTASKPLNVSKYRYIDNKKMEASWSTKLYCGNDEYLAGVSFLTGRGGPTYGIKSVLCGSTNAGITNSCQELEGESCPKHQFMRGIEVGRAYRDKGLMGVVCSKAVGEGRDDDQFEYCDHVRRVMCCSFPTSL